MDTLSQSSIGFGYLAAQIFQSFPEKRASSLIQILLRLHSGKGRLSDKDLLDLCSVDPRFHTAMSQKLKRDLSQIPPSELKKRLRRISDPKALSTVIFNIVAQYGSFSQGSHNVPTVPEPDCAEVVSTTSGETLENLGDIKKLIYTLTDSVSALVRTQTETSQVTQQINQKLEDGLSEMSSTRSIESSQNAETTTEVLDRLEQLQESLTEQHRELGIFLQETILENLREVNELPEEVDENADEYGENFSEIDVESGLTASNDDFTSELSTEELHDLEDEPSEVSQNETEEIAQVEVTHAEEYEDYVEIPKTS